MKALPESWNIWKRLGFVLAMTPVLCIAGLLILKLIGDLNNAVMECGRGRWWAILIVGFILTLIYVFYIDAYRRDRIKEKNRENTANTLILYWQGRCKEEGKPLPDEQKADYMRGQLVERLKCWAWADPTLWSRYYPDEKYSENIIKMTDGAVAEMERGLAGVEERVMSDKYKQK